MTASTISKTARYSGYVLSALPSLLLLFSASMKFTHPASLDAGFEHLGWPVSLALTLGILEAGCVVIYLIPPTAILGAILMTGYLGGAMATHLRIGEPVFMQLALGVLAWGGLFLRDPRLRALIPLRR